MDNLVAMLVKKCVLKPFQVSEDKIGISSKIVHFSFEFFQISKYVLADVSPKNPWHVDDIHEKSKHELYSLVEFLFSHRGFSKSVTGDW